MTGITPEDSRLRQHLAQSQIERIEMIYVDTVKRWGEIPVVLVLDPRDSCAQAICEGHQDISEESVRTVLRDALARDERPLMIIPIGLDVALHDSFAGPAMQEQINARQRDAMCVVVIAEEGKTFMAFPLPDSDTLDTRGL